MKITPFQRAVLVVVQDHPWVSAREITCFLDGEGFGPILAITSQRTRFKTVLVTLDDLYLNGKIVRRIDIKKESDPTCNVLHASAIHGDIPITCES